MDSGIIFMIIIIYFHSNYYYYYYYYYDNIANDQPSNSPDIILLMDSSGKCIDTNKYLPNIKMFTPTIADATEVITGNKFGNPSTLVIHTGTNDIENSSLDSCFDSFQTLLYRFSQG